jgi:molybdenum cofactor cytidylyltransferase
MALRGDLGARDLLKAAKAIDLPGGELDIDTLDDLERALQMYSR